MNFLNRRTILTVAAALGASAASAQQSNEPVIGNKGASILGPRDPEREQQNPDILRPPATDHGSIPNLRFTFADAHMKVRDGGWSREVTQRELPISTSMAGVNMRLKAGGVREMHWHKQAEWSFMLSGKARITAVDNDGHNFIADVGPGDLWYFPSRIQFRDWPTRVASSYWRFPMESFPKTAPLRLRISSLTTTAACWQKILTSK